MARSRGQVNPIRWVIMAIVAMLCIGLLSAFEQRIEVEGQLSGTADGVLASGGKAIALLAPDAGTVLLAIVAILIGLAVSLRQ